MEVQITMDSVCLASEDVVAREIEGDLIIVPLVAGIGNADDELYTLNETGKAIWQKLDGKLTLGQVVEALSRDFSASEEKMQRDVLGFVHEMVRRGILAVKE